jgi:nicotinamide-nucleotide amidase
LSAPRVELVAVGDELVHGVTVDTNSAWLARACEALGLAVGRVTVVRDDEDELRDVVASAADRCEVVLMTGGLGPTADDRTRSACARAAGVALRFDEPSWQDILAWFARTGRDVPESNRRQAELPATADALPNGHGTAPGFEVAIGRARVFALPGVPREMRGMFVDVVEPRLRASLADRLRPLALAELHLLGIGEAALGEHIVDLMQPGEPEVGITARDGLLTVRVALGAPDPVAAQGEADAVVAEIRRRVPPEFVVYEGRESLADHLGRRLVEAGRTLAVAESCTGGMLGGEITGMAGISPAFPGGFITYSDAAKTAELGVPEELLAAHGAVSVEVAAAMARGAQARTGADLAVAISGVAGPGGGTEDKPVGTVCFAVAEARAGAVDVRSWRRRFPDLGREFVRRRSVVEALANVLRAVETAR